jgi:hypothetical protein
MGDEVFMGKQAVNRSQTFQDVTLMWFSKHRKIDEL